MSRKIDFTKKLSESDREWLLQWGRRVDVQRNDAQFASTATKPKEADSGPPEDVSGATDDDSMPADGKPEKFTEEWYDSATVSELQEELRNRKLPVSGKRDELADRLYEAVEDENA